MEPQVPMGKLILNSKLRTTNLVPRDKLISVAKNCLDDMFTFLSRHYGPFSRYTLVIHNVGSNGMSMNASGSESDTKIFTKDGIESLKSIEYVSPIETFLKSLLAYIGKRVEHSCKDGTTTAMMVAAAILEETFNHLDKFDKYPTKKIETAYEEMVKDLLEYHEARCKYTVDGLYDLLRKLDPEITKAEVVSAVAWTQAYVSSGGDKDIADCIGEAFKDLPDIAWDSLSIRRSAMETEKKISLVREDSDFTFESYLVNQEMMKHHGNDIRLVLEDANMLVFPFDIVDGSMDTIDLMKFIDGYKVSYIDKETKVLPPLVLVACQFHPKAIESVRALVVKHDIQVYMFAYAKKTSRTVNFDCQAWAVNAMAGVKSADAWAQYPLEDRIIPHARVEFQGRSLELHNLYEKKGTGALHPGVEDPENYPEFAHFQKSMELNIEKLKKAHVVTVTEIEELEIALSKAMCPKKPIVYLGGTSHDQLAYVSVLQDVIGATLCTLQEGFYVNAVKNMCNTVTSDDFAEIVADDPIKNCLRVIFWDAFSKTVSMDNRVGKVAGMLSTGNYIDYTAKGALPTSVLGFFLSKIKGNNEIFEEYGCPPIQVGYVFKELFTRVGELLIRFAATSDMAVPGMAWDDSKDKED